MSEFMKKPVVTLGFLLAAALGAGQANAQTSVGQLYGSIGLGSLSTSKDLGDVNLGAVTLRAGTRLNPYVGFEGELAFGLQDDSEGGVNTELSRQYAAYLVAYAPIRPNADLFARIGYGAQKYRFEQGDALYEPVLESVNLGLGAQYFFDDRNGVRADLTHQEFVDSKADADTVSVSYVRKF